MQYEHGRSPLDRLDQAAVHYASAVKLKPRDPQLHFLLGQVLEEQHYAAEMYGLKKTVAYRNEAFTLCLRVWPLTFPFIHTGDY